MKEKSTDIILDGIAVKLYFRRVKRLRLTVRDGEAFATAPLYMPRSQAEDFVRSKQKWIKARAGLYAQPDGGGVMYLWGRGCAVKTAEGGKCAYDEGCIYLPDTADMSLLRRKVKEFYRDELMTKARGFLDYWQDKTGLHCACLRTRDMRMRWGSCNTAEKRIWLSLRLAKYDERCLSYVVLHELLHLAVKAHDGRFYALLDGYLPEWRQARELLRRTLP